MKRKLRNLLLASLVVTMTCSAFGRVAVSPLFSDGMVLQRDMPIHVWGMAAAGEQVSVTIAKETVSGSSAVGRGDVAGIIFSVRDLETKSVTADSLGHWDVYLSPTSAGGPYELKLKGSDAAAFTIHDVLVGDVWVAAGQSNMEFPMRRVVNADAEMAAANVPAIRLVRVHKASSEYPLADVVLDSAWQKCDPEAVKEFSAVAFYFGREIAQTQKIPVGIIESSWGGTVAEAWTSLRSLSADAALMPVFAARYKFMEHQADLPLVLASEQRQMEQAKAEGKPAPQVPWRPRPETWAPAGLYNAMIAPLTKFPIRGVIWYQGESNSAVERAPMYERLFQTMIRDWRDRWGQGEFPFLFVQLPNYGSGASEDWAMIREAQRRTLVLRNTGMAVAIDQGEANDVHPKIKTEVGHRLALAARANVYGEKVEFSGPLFRQVTREDHALRVWFDHAEGLQAQGTVLKGFEIAGDDGKFVAADAKIDGTSVVVSNADVANPVSVRYAWANNPQCNLMNRAGLPASPFRSMN